MASPSRSLACWPMGGLDASFSGDGLAMIEAGPFLDTTDAVAIAADGSIVVGAGA